MATDLLFQTVTVLEEPPEGWAASPLPPPPGDHCVLSAPSPMAMPKHPLTVRINQEIEGLAPRIRAVMQARGGVLLTVSIQERVPSDPNEDPSYKFNFVSVNRPGPVPTLVLRTHLTSRPRVGEAAEGYVAQEIFLWATKV